MSIAKKIAHKAEAVKGAVKKTAGRVTGNRRLRAEGRGDQAKGNAQAGRGEGQGRPQALTPAARSPHSRPPRGLPRPAGLAHRLEPRRHERSTPCLSASEHS